MRVSIVVAIGAVGEPDDLERFTEVMTADFEQRCYRAVDKVFGGRIQLLLPEVEDAAEDEDDAGTGDGRNESQVRSDGVELHSLRRELTSEEEEPQDEPGPDEA